MNADYTPLPFYTTVTKIEIEKLRLKQRSFLTLRSLCLLLLGFLLLISFLGKCAGFNDELELELILSQMAQKPMLRGEVGARALRVRSDVRGHG